MVETIQEDIVDTIDGLERNEVSLGTNYDNVAFYENLTPKDMYNFAVKGGLATGCDVTQLMPYIRDAESLLEVGAGYGRVISCLMSQEFKGKISAIERSNILYEYISSRYADSVKLFNIDIHDCQAIQESFDVILFLWSGIADFSFQEQRQVICNLKELLKDNGTLILDTLPEDIKPLGMEHGVTGKDFLFSFNNATVHTYKISKEDIALFAEEAGFKNVRHLPYQTDTMRKRLLHILS